MRNVLLRQLWVGLGLCLGLVLGLVPGVATAESPVGDELAFVGELTPVAGEDLEEARGGAALPDGFGIEVTAMLRVLAEGQELASMTGHFGGPGGLGVHAGLLNSQGAPFSGSLLDNPIIVNSLDGITIHDYREITVYIDHLPVPATRAGSAIPEVVLPGHRVQY